MPSECTVSEAQQHLQKWMNADNGPSLRILLEALARICLSVASERRDHILTSSEAEYVWKPTAKEIIRVKQFVERKTAQYVVNRQPSDTAITP